MATTIIIALIGLCSTLIGSLIAYVFAIRKNRAEVLSIELENTAKVIAIWREMSEEQSSRIEELETKLELLQKLIETLENDFKLQCDTCVYKIHHDKTITSGIIK